MADEEHIEGGATNETFEMDEQPPAPPTIDDIEIPPPPNEMPPPLDEEPPPPPRGEEPPPPPDVEAPAPPPSPPPPPEEEIQDPEPEAKLEPDAPPEYEPVAEDEPNVEPEYEPVVAPPDEPESELSPQQEDEPEVESPSPEPDVESPTDPSVVESPNDIHDANTLPSTRPMTTSGGDPENPRSNGMSAKEMQSGKRGGKTYRREAIMWVIIFVLVACVAAVIFYFAFNVTIAKTQTLLPEGPFTIRVAMVLERTWNPNLSVSSTTLHAQLSEDIVMGLDTTFRDSSSELEDVYERSEIFSFSDQEGSTRASFESFFSGPLGDDDVISRQAFTSIVREELNDGFDDGNFGNETLTAQRDITVITYMET